MQLNSELHIRGQQPLWHHMADWTLGMVTMKYMYMHNYMITQMTLNIASKILHVCVQFHLYQYLHTFFYFATSQYSFIRIRPIEFSLLLRRLLSIFKLVSKLNFRWLEEKSTKKKSLIDVAPPFLPIKLYILRRKLAMKCIHGQIACPNVQPTPKEAILLRRLWVEESNCKWSYGLSEQHPTSRVTLLSS